MMKRYLLPFFILFGLGLHAQKQIHVSGTVREGSKPLDNVNIFFTHKSDTILETSSDSAGKYEFTATIAENENYEISVPADEYFGPREIIWVEDNWIGPFIVDIYVVSKLREIFDNCPHYKLNETDHFHDYDFEPVKKKMSEFPAYCLELQHLARPEESSKILNKRAENFTRFLISQGIDPSHFHFNKEVKILNTDFHPDNQPRITTQVISLEENCK